MSPSPRVLMVTPWAPFPVDAGSRRVWTACKYLKDRYRFELLTFFNPWRSYSGISDPEADAARNTAQFIRLEHVHLRGIFDDIHTVAHSYEPEPGMERLDGTAVPEDVRRFYASSMREKIYELIRDRHVELVHVEFDLMAPYIRWIKAEFPKIPCLFTHHDMGSISLFRSYFREMSGWRRFRRLVPWWRRILFTRKVCCDPDGMIVLTEADARRLGRHADSKKIHVVPTGVDLEHFAELPPRQNREPDNLVYVGHYPHYPNEDAVLWFATEILPLIWRRRPSVRFTIVGSYPTEPIRRLAEWDRRIAVTGTVEDVKPYETGAMALVAPIRLGQGIKGKLLEAFAAGTPVVATSCANEGIQGVADRELLLADSPRAFAAQTLRVLEDEALWERLSSGGRAFVESSHSWTRRANQLDAVYRSVLAR